MLWIYEHHHWLACSSFSPFFFATLYTFSRFYIHFTFSRNVSHGLHSLLRYPSTRREIVLAIGFVSFYRCLWRQNGHSSPYYETWRVPLRMRKYGVWGKYYLSKGRTFLWTNLNSIKFKTIWVTKMTELN